MSDINLYLFIFAPILEVFNKGIIPQYENKDELLEFIIDKILMIEKIIVQI